MNAFVKAATSPSEARTQNGMKALNKTGSACVDLFSAVGAMRGQDIIPLFASAYAENSELALRIMLWARDARQGAGERALFRSVLNYLERIDPVDAARLMLRAPELGRWDDVLVVESPEAFQIAAEMIRKALAQKNGLAAKWAPRKGPLAARLRTALGMTPKQYRKTLVSLTNVVETKMCANEWDKINFEHVPSLAAARYKRAFKKHVPQAFAQYATKAAAGEAKVNAGAVYPYDVLKGVISNNGMSNDMRNMSAAELDHIRAQWNALPNYMTNANILPVVDVSGSMYTPAGRADSVTCLDVALSLGLYCADKNKGAFKDLFATFSSSPELVHLRGDIISKVAQMSQAKWGLSTVLHKVIELILRHAVSHKVPESDMPTMILIMSDMQFNSCVRFDDSAYEMIVRKYNDAGYKVPVIVFWNIRDHGNKPVSASTKNVALVSGFSPAIVKSLLSADADSFTPEGIMYKTVMNERYDV